MKFEKLKSYMSQYKTYDIKNAEIESVDLSMADHCVLVLQMCLKGDGWGITYGGYSLGHGYVGADDSFFEGSAKGMESIIRIMDTVGVDRFQDLVGKHIRVISTGYSEPIKIIGNLIEDKWFNIETFYKN